MGFVRGRKKNKGPISLEHDNHQCISLGKQKSSSVCLYCVYVHVYNLLMWKAIWLSKLIMLSGAQIRVFTLSSAALGRERPDHTSLALFLSPPLSSFPPQHLFLYHLQTGDRLKEKAPSGALLRCPVLAQIGQVSGTVMEGWDASHILSTGVLMRWCFHENAANLKSGIGHQLGLELVTMKVIGFPSFWDFRTIQWYLVMCGWGRGDPGIDHTHQDRMVTLVLE